MPTPVDDPEDPRVELYRGLPDAALRMRTEGEHGVFVVEGPLSLRTLLLSPYPLVSVLLRPERVAGLADVVSTARHRGVPVYVAGRQVFDGIAGFPVHRGVLALARRLPHPDPLDVLAQVTAAVVVEGVNDHENLGAIFRNAAALGAGAVVLDPTCCDPLYRRSVRVSMGQVLRLPFTRLAPWPGALTHLRTAGFTLVALDPGAPDTVDALALGPEGRAEMPAPDALTASGRPKHSSSESEQGAGAKLHRVAVLVGAEGRGLTEGARLASSRRVRIPMMPGVDSLNVATALAIALHRLVQPG